MSNNGPKVKGKDMHEDSLKRRINPCIYFSSTHLERTSFSLSNSFNLFKKHDIVGNCLNIKFFG